MNILIHKKLDLCQRTLVLRKLKTLCSKQFILPDLLISKGSLLHDDEPLYAAYLNRCSIFLGAALIF